ncbi:hypothetical protein GCK72_001799 [Caenorhabditis remanei]|uniref:Uncharacterized protein n=1 Tax=Caenorhabditis remanei TaxID=31234 RepID=A0A6A5HW18_CAERE|nr:hypothetical protein GCK72_001799 [Caenorhabditis remanei]KAF1769982.1 hypothetical protein GCK72_001799 [Caenorhabditis remanei]
MAENAELSNLEFEICHSQFLNGLAPRPVAEAAELIRTGKITLSEAMDRFPAPGCSTIDRTTDSNDGNSMHPKRGMFNLNGLLEKKERILEEQAQQNDSHQLAPLNMDTSFAQRNPKFSSSVSNPPSSASTSSSAHTSWILEAPLAHMLAPFNDKLTDEQVEQITAPLICLLEEDLKKPVKSKEWMSKVKNLSDLIANNQGLTSIRERDNYIRYLFKKNEVPETFISSFMKEKSDAFMLKSPSRLPGPLLNHPTRPPLPPPYSPAPSIPLVSSSSPYSAASIPGLEVVASWSDEERVRFLVNELFKLRKSCLDQDMKMKAVFASLLICSHYCHNLTLESKTDYINSLLLKMGFSANQIADILESGKEVIIASLKQDSAASNSSLASNSSQMTCPPLESILDKHLKTMPDAATTGNSATVQSPVAPPLAPVPSNVSPNPMPNQPSGEQVRFAKLLQSAEATKLRSMIKSSSSSEMKDVCCTVFFLASKLEKNMDFEKKSTCVIKILLHLGYSVDAAKNIAERGKELLRGTAREKRFVNSPLLGPSTSQPAPGQTVYNQQFPQLLLQMGSSTPQFMQGVQNLPCRNSVITQVPNPYSSVPSTSQVAPPPIGNEILRTFMSGQRNLFPQIPFFQGWLNPLALPILGFPTTQRSVTLPTIPDVPETPEATTEKTKNKRNRTTAKPKMIGPKKKAGRPKKSKRGEKDNATPEEHGDEVQQEVSSALEAEAISRAFLLATYQSAQSTAVVPSPNEGSTDYMKVANNTAEPMDTDQGTANKSSLKTDVVVPEQEERSTMNHADIEAVKKPMSLLKTTQNLETFLNASDVAVSIDIEDAEKTEIKEMISHSDSESLKSRQCQEPLKSVIPNITITKSHIDSSVESSAEKVLKQNAARPASASLERQIVPIGVNVSSKRPLKRKARSASEPPMKVAKQRQPEKKANPVIMGSIQSEGNQKNQVRGMREKTQHAKSDNEQQSNSSMGLDVSSCTMDADALEFELGLVTNSMKPAFEEEDGCCLKKPENASPTSDYMDTLVVTAQKNLVKKQTDSSGYAETSIRTVEDPSPLLTVEKTVPVLSKSLLNSPEQITGSSSQSSRRLTDYPQVIGVDYMARSSRAINEESDTSMPHPIKQFPSVTSCIDSESADMVKKDAEISIDSVKSKKSVTRERTTGKTAATELRVDELSTQDTAIFNQRSLNPATVSGPMLRELLLRDTIVPQIALSTLLVLEPMVSKELVQKSTPIISSVPPSRPPQIETASLLTQLFEAKKRSRMAPKLIQTESEDFMVQSRTSDVPTDHKLSMPSATAEAKIRMSSMNMPANSSNTIQTASQKTATIDSTLTINKQNGHRKTSKMVHFKSKMKETVKSAPVKAIPNNCTISKPLMMPDPHSKAIRNLQEQTTNEFDYSSILNQNYIVSSQLSREISSTIPTAQNDFIQEPSIRNVNAHIRTTKAVVPEMMSMVTGNTAAKPTETVQARSAPIDAFPFPTLLSKNCKIPLDMSNHTAIPMSIPTNTVKSITTHDPITSKFPKTMFSASSNSQAAVDDLSADSLLPQSMNDQSTTKTASLVKPTASGSLPHGIHIPQPPVNPPDTLVPKEPEYLTDERSLNHLLHLASIWLKHDPEGTLQVPSLSDLLQVPFIETPGSTISFAQPILQTAPAPITFSDIAPSNKDDGQRFQVSAIEKVDSMPLIQKPGPRNSHATAIEASANEVMPMLEEQVPPKTPEYCINRSVLKRNKDQADEIMNVIMIQAKIKNRKRQVAQVDSSIQQPDPKRAREQIGFKPASLCPRHPHLNGEKVLSRLLPSVPNPVSYGEYPTMDIEWHITYTRWSRGFGEISRVSIGCRHLYHSEWIDASRCQEKAVPCFTRDREFKDILRQVLEISKTEMQAEQSLLNILNQFPLMRDYPQFAPFISAHIQTATKVMPMTNYEAKAPSNFIIQALNYLSDLHEKGVNITAEEVIAFIVYNLHDSFACCYAVSSFKTIQKVLKKHVNAQEIHDEIMLD